MVSSSNQNVSSKKQWLSSLWIPIIAGGLIMGLALGVRHVQGLFLLPITIDRDWSREMFGFAIAIQNLTWGIAQPFTGMIADRFGSAKVIVGGLIFYAMGLYFMVYAGTSTQFILSAGICIGIALAGTGFGTIYGALSRIVPAERRSWALGLAGAIGGLGQFAMVPSAQILITSWNWTGALLILSIVMAFFIPLTFSIRDKSIALVQNETEQTMLAAITEAFRHRGFWLLNFGFLACGFQLAFLAMHLPAYLLDKGMEADDAVGALAIVALTNVLGTYLFGVLGGLVRRKYLLAGIYLVRSCAMALFIFLPLSIWSMYIFAALMGLLWLGTVPLTNGLISQLFGVRYITTLFGFVFFGHQLGSFFGVWLGGVFFEMTGSYQGVWYISIALGLIAMLVHLPIDDRAMSRPSTQVAPA